MPAARSSKNRPKGTPVTQPVPMTRELYRDLMVNKVIPAIKAVWPEKPTETVASVESALEALETMYGRMQDEQAITELCEKFGDLGVPEIDANEN